MEVITIETSAFIRLQSMFEKTVQLTEMLANDKLKQDRYMSIKEAQEYTGFGSEWLNKRKEAIGYFQQGAKDIRFKKSDIDKYFETYRIQKKIR